HQVMPCGDRFRSIQIGVDLIAAIAAFETRLIRTDTQMQASRTGLRRVAWVDIYDLHSCAGRLVADHPLQLSKTPFVYAFCIAGLANPAEVFEDDPLIVRFRISHDLFADAVIGVRDETPLTSRDTLPALVWRSCRRWPGEIVSSFCSRLFCAGYSSPCGTSHQMSPPHV